MYFPALAGQYQSQSGKVPDTANPSMPIQICPAPPPLFRRIGLAIGYWEPMALTDVTRSPGCMVNWASACRLLVKRHRNGEKG
ncbi:TraU family protein [Escherichia coli]|uniref:TraU family protein n=1 Tax=Escherichia coli TaxID=562 RepID=UPI00334197A3